MAVKTLARHRKVIFDAMKIDIRTSASATLGDRMTINAARVFRWDNRVVPDQVDIDNHWDLAQAPR